MIARSDIPLVLFAKAPIAGKVKTRLTQHCTPQQAAAIAEILIEESLKRALRYWPGKVYLSIWQFDQHPFITTMLARYEVDFLAQLNGSLGEKMLDTFKLLDYPTAIVGCDAPLIDPDTYRQAHQQLTMGRHVIGPSEDGGYYLIGASGPIAPLFENIDWGSASVLEQSLQAALRHEIDINCLPESFDVDRWDDVVRASAKIPSLQYFLD